MGKEKEFPNLINEKDEIKLYEEESRHIKSPSVLDLSVTQCPIACNNCKTVYSNKSTGFKITCYCKCHELEK